MANEREFLEFVAGVLGVESDSLSLETTYGSIPEWDSMAQLRLVTEGAVRFGEEIPFADVVRVTSLWEFYRRFNGLPPKKVVAVDLDNTLWKGVIGEDGPEGIRPDLPILKSLKSLKYRGVLLVMLSRNNERDVWEGLGRLEGLGGATKDDFVAWRIDWNEKADNLRSVAAELNLGTDAFVFVDDNPAERLKMRSLVPDVAVAEFPPNLAAYFPEGDLTEEDRRKTEEYKAEAKRKSHLENLGLLPSPAVGRRMPTAGSQQPTSSPPLDVWTALGCRIDVHVMDEGESARVAQLSQKANQFNVRTNRLTEEEIRRLAEEGLVITCHVGDDFGDQGLVGFAVVRPEADGKAHVTDWVMSCRVTGRGVEERFEDALERILTARDVRGLTASWRDSGKNAPVRDLFDRLGFDRIGDAAGERRYRKVL